MLRQAREQGCIFGTIGAWIIGLTVIGIITTFLWMAVRPALYNLDTAAIRQSNQYVMTQQTQLRQWHVAYLKLDTDIATGVVPQAQGRAQQAAIVAQMRQAADTLQPEQVPPDIASFLANY